jgi:hypothetical protein
MQNGTTQAWFYSSKGLNELFLRPRKPKLSGLKTTMQLNANPKPLPPSSPQTLYVEALKMDARETKARARKRNARWMEIVAAQTTMGSQTMEAAVLAGGVLSHLAVTNMVTT